MIKIGDHLCYSPFPPERYALGPLGFGAVGRRDMQLWNLVYLSCARIEDHLDPKCYADIEAVGNRDFVVRYTAHAALYGDNCKGLFPGLRSALQKHPSVFLQELRTMDWELLPMAREIPGWNDIVIDKVASISAQAKVHLNLLFTPAASKINQQP